MSSLLRRPAFRVLTRHAIPAVVAAIWVLPLWTMLVGALRPLGAAPPRGLELFPGDPTLEAFRRVNDLLPLAAYTRNSLFLVLVAVPLAVTVAALAGYGIRTLGPRRARSVVIAVVAAMLVPASAVWASRFELFEMAGLAASPAAVVAPAFLGANPLYVLLYAWAFSRVEDEQLEAARLDGARELTVWWRIALPQVGPTTLAVTVLAFAFHWSDFVGPLLYLRGVDEFTLPIGLRFLQQLNPTDRPMLMAGALLFTIPVVIVLLIAQRVLFEDPRVIVRGEQR